MIRILIVDDHPLVRAGLRALAEDQDTLELVGEAADGESAVQVAESLRPDVVLMDLSMPGLGGVAATRLLRERCPAAAVVVLTSFPDHDRVTAAMQAGAVGYLLKDSDTATLLRGIHEAAAGHAPIDPRVARALLPVADTGGPAEDLGLSARELDVLRLVTQGLANKQIGRALGISESTVKTHIGNIFRTIGVTDRTSAAMWARSHGVA